MTTILVTGVGGPAGRAVARMLLDRGYTVYGVDMAPVTPDGFEFTRVPAARDARFLECLCEAAGNAHADLIIPTVTEELPVIAEGWKTEYPIMISAARAVRTADDKYLTALCLEQAGVAVPRFSLPGGLRSPQEVQEKIGWPCISKPRRGRGGRGVRLHQMEDWPLVARLGEDTILQEFAGGTDYAPNVFIGQGSQTSVVVVIEKTELKEGIIGNAISVRRVPGNGGVEDVAELAVAAAQAIGLVGPQDVDIRRLADGQPVVLEINARFGANIASAPEVLEAALRSFGI